jgi:hypothetical protein
MTSPHPHQPPARPTAVASAAVQPAPGEEAAVDQAAVEQAAGDQAAGGRPTPGVNPLADLDELDELDRTFLQAAQAGQALLTATSPAGGAGRVPAEDEDEGADGLAPYCASLEQWVTEVFAPTYARRATPTFRWCASWWQHAEAISRLEALWRSWETLRRDPLLGMATWYRDYLDSQLPVLTGPAGPFADCDPTRHFPAEQPALPVIPAPAGWWPPLP